MSTLSTAQGATAWNAPVITPLRSLQKAWAIFQLARRQAALSDTLFDLSDAELSRRGLNRDQIPQMVADIAA